MKATVDVFTISDILKLESKIIYFINYMTFMAKNPW